MTRSGAAIATVLAAALLTSCAAGGTTGPSSPPAAGTGGAGTDGTSTPPVTEPRLTGCAAPARELVVLCEGVELAVEHHVDPVDTSELAAAAILGVPQGQDDGSGPPVPMPPCPVPAEGFQEVCARIADAARRGIDPGAAADAAVAAMYRYALDPYSVYLPPVDEPVSWVLGPGSLPWLGFSMAIVGAGDGPCAVVGDACRLVVTSVLPQSGAERAGVLPGDEILAVGGDPVSGRSIEELVPALAVAGGAEVDVDVARPGTVLHKRIVADVVAFSAGEAEAVVPGIVRLWLADFSEEAARLAGRVLGAPEVQEARGLILDLRGNPGGLLLAAQAVASQFLEEGIVFVERTPEGDRSWPVLEGGLAPPDLPVVVLVDRGTASAAEIVAAALQEAGRATVVGTSTFGKDLVQEAFDSRAGGAFRITIAHWTTAAGRDVAFSGLPPDVDVPDPPSDGRDPALERAVRLLGG